MTGTSIDNSVKEEVERTLLNEGMGTVVELSDLSKNDYYGLKETLTANPIYDVRGIISLLNIGESCERKYTLHISMRGQNA